MELQGLTRWNRLPLDSQASCRGFDPHNPLQYSRPIKDPQRYVVGLLKPRCTPICRKSGYFTGSNTMLKLAMASLCMFGITWEYMSIVIPIPTSRYTHCWLLSRRRGRPCWRERCRLCSAGSSSPLFLSAILSVRRLADGVIGSAWQNH